MDKNRKKQYLLLLFTAILLTAAAVLFILRDYMSRVDNRIYLTSTTNLREVYSQVNDKFSQIVNEQWDLLAMSEAYIDSNADAPEAILSFVDDWKLSRKFTDFYFINTAGEWCTPDGSTGTMSFGSAWGKLVSKQEKVIVDADTQNQEPFMLFAIPVDTGTYNGFSYDALAVSYSSDALNAALGVSAFRGQATCYVTDVSVNVIFSDSPTKPIGKNLLNLVFRTENGVAVPNRDTLMQMLNSELKEPQVLQAYFEKIRDSYAYVDNYYIMLVYGVYDVPGKTADGIEMEDASDVVYKFNLTLLCPLKPSKAGLMYNPVDNSLENAMRNMMVEMPMNGFLFPAFNERMSDVHAALYYTKKPSELNDSLLMDVFGCEIPATAGKQNEMFINAIEAVEEMTFDKAKAIYSNMREHEMELKDSQEEVVVDKKETARILEESGFEEEEIQAFTKTFDEATEENGKVLLSNVFEGSNKLKIKSGKTEVSLPVEHTDAIEVRKIDGKNCIVIEISDDLLVNGVKINKFDGPIDLSI